MIRACSFVIPGDWLTPTGGYRYDRKIVLAMRDAGWRVDVIALADGFPWPDEGALNDADRKLSHVPAGSLVVVDGLAFGAMPELVRRHASRLTWVALVHHPLHLETGLHAAMRDALFSAERQALQYATRVIVTSESTVADVAALGVEMRRISVVEPGTDRPSGARNDWLAQNGSPSSPHPAPAIKARSTVRLLCVATLVPRKGHAVLLEALSGLLSLDWTLDCVGSMDRDAATAGRLRQTAVELGLSGRVNWSGEMGEAALSMRYGAADVFVLPSFYEGFGMVVTEALAHGLPVVTTTGGALGRTLPAGAGIHVPPGDVPALREALRRVIADAAVRGTLAAGARAAGLQLRSWVQAAERFGSLLEGVEP